MNRYFQKLIIFNAILLLSCNEESELKLTDQELVLKNTQSFYFNFVEGDKLKIEFNAEKNEHIWLRIEPIESNTPIINKKIIGNYEEKLRIVSGGIYEIRLINKDTISINYSIVIKRVPRSKGDINLTQKIVEKYDTTYQNVEKIKFEIAPRGKKNVSFKLPENTDYWVYSINTINEISDEKIILNSLWDQVVRFGLRRLDRIPEFNSSQKFNCFFSSQKESSDFANGSSKIPEKWQGFKSGYDAQEINDLVLIRNTPSKKIGIGFENKNEFQLVNIIVNAVSFNIDTTYEVKIK